MAPCPQVHCDACGLTHGHGILVFGVSSSRQLKPEGRGQVCVSCFWCIVPLFTVARVKNQAESTNWDLNDHHSHQKFWGATFLVKAKGLIFKKLAASWKSFFLTNYNIMQIQPFLIPSSATAGSRCRWGDARQESKTSTKLLVL